MSFTKDKDSDNYATDKLGWEIIQEYIPKDKKIWSPFYCDGKQKEYFTEMGYDIIHEDKDFFSYTPEYDIIIDNPPFCKVMLMKWFQRLFKEHLQVIIPFKRPTFTHLINPKKGYTPPYGTQYYCYKMNLEKDLIFI